MQKCKSPLLRICRGLSAQVIPVSFHKRPLPPSLIALSSLKGKLIFKEALLCGDMECFFPLSEQFVTQSEPSFCALSSLVVVLNALNHDPKKTWKGVWRWVSEEMLQCETTDICGHSLEKVKQDGMNFTEFESIARCHGVRINSYRAIPPTIDSDEDRNLILFRNIIQQTCRKATAEEFIVVNFSRKGIGQTGDGHFSPIGGYHQGLDLVLIMDVARFKYPPFWISLEELWKSMCLIDKQTQRTRGYFVISSWKNDSSKIRLDNHIPEDVSSAYDANHECCPPMIRTWHEASVDSNDTNNYEDDQHNHATCSHNHCQNTTKSLSQPQPDLSPPTT